MNDFINKINSDIRDRTPHSKKIKDVMPVMLARALHEKAKEHRKNSEVTIIVTDEKVYFQFIKQYLDALGLDYVYYDERSGLTYASYYDRDDFVDNSHNYTARYMFCLDDIKLYQNKTSFEWQKIESIYNQMTEISDIRYLFGIKKDSIDYCKKTRDSDEFLLFETIIEHLNVTSDINIKSNIDDTSIILKEPEKVVTNTTLNYSKTPYSGFSKLLFWLFILGAGGYAVYEVIRLYLIAQW